MERIERRGFMGMLAGWLGLSAAAVAEPRYDAAAELAAMKSEVGRLVPYGGIAADLRHLSADEIIRDRMARDPELDRAMRETDWIPRDGIQGVGVIRFPVTDPEARKHAEAMVSGFRQGTMLVMPNTRDTQGNYEWDFRIEGGDPGQVRVERAPESHEIRGVFGPDGHRISFEEFDPTEG
jgi:hypothetical protein